MKFPKTIFIQRDPNAEKGELSPLAWERTEDVDDGELAVYELKKVVKKRTEVIIEE